MEYNNGTPVDLSQFVAYIKKENPINTDIIKDTLHSYVKSRHNIPTDLVEIDNTGGGHCALYALLLTGIPEFSQKRADGKDIPHTVQSFRAMFGKVDILTQNYSPNRLEQLQNGPGTRPIPYGWLDTVDIGKICEHFKVKVLLADGSTNAWEQIGFDKALDDTYDGIVKTIYIRHVASQTGSYDVIRHNYPSLYINNRANSNALKQKSSEENLGDKDEGRGDEVADSKGKYLIGKDWNPNFIDSKGRKGRFEAWSDPDHYGNKTVEGQKIVEDALIKDTEQNRKWGAGGYGHHFTTLIPKSAISLPELRTAIANRDKRHSDPEKTLGKFFQDDKIYWSQFGVPRVLDANLDSDKVLMMQYLRQNRYLADEWAKKKKEEGKDNKNKKTFYQFDNGLVAHDYGYEAEQIEKGYWLGDKIIHETNKKNEDKQDKKKKGSGVKTHIDDEFEGISKLEASDRKYIILNNSQVSFYENSQFFNLFKNITLLALNNCAISDRSFSNFKLGYLHNLEVLELADNLITEKLEMLWSSETIKHFSIGGCPVSLDQLKLLSKTKIVELFAKGTKAETDTKKRYRTELFQVIDSLEILDGLPGA